MWCVLKNWRYTDICIPGRIGQYPLGDHPRDNILGSWCAAHLKIVIAFALRFVQLSDAQNAHFTLSSKSYAGPLVQRKSPEGARSKDSLAKMRRIFQFHLGSNVSVFVFWQCSASIPTLEGMNLITNLQRPAMVAFPPEDRSRHYEFTDSPACWRPDSPFIERQNLNVADEALLRHACSILCEDIQSQERSSQMDQPNPTSASKIFRRKSAPLRTASNSSRYSLLASRNPHPEDLVGKGKYDSGIEMEAEDSTDAHSNANFAVYSEDAPSKNLIEERPVTATEVDTASSETNTQANTSLDPLQLDRCDKNREQHPLSTSEKFSCLDFSPPGSDYSEDSIVRSTTRTDMKSAGSTRSKELTSISSMPARTPSFTRPKSGQFEATKRSSENLASSDNLTSKEAPQTIAPERYSWQPMVGLQKKSDQDKSMCALQFPERPGTRDEKGIAAIIDTDGAERIITAAEEKRRYLDLQRAVMEKMFTGTISAAVADSSTIFDSVSDGPPYGKTDAIGCQPIKPGKSSLDNAQAGTLFARDRTSSMIHSTQEKGSTIMRKLSIFGLGKRKPGNSPGGTNMVGYSRIVEAS